MFTDADVIHSYTRAQAIADGVLVDITEQAKAYGFKLPTAITETAWRQVVEWTEHDKRGLGQSSQGRLHDVLVMALMAARATQGDRAPFQVLAVPRSGKGEKARMHDLVLHIGPGDKGEPVLTIMLPGED